MTEFPLPPDQSQKQRLFDRHHARLWTAGPGHDPASYGRRHVVLENILSSQQNPRASIFLNSIIQDFAPGERVDRAVIEVLGINNMGKSSVVQGLVARAEEEFAQMYPTSHAGLVSEQLPMVVTHDFVDTLPAARLATGHALSLGEITEQEYREVVAPVDNEIMDLVLRFAPRRVLLIGEHPATETFDKNDQPVGPSRGSFAKMKERATSGEESFRIIYVYTTAAQRHESVLFREMIRDLANRPDSGQELVAALIKSGIDDDRIIDPARVFAPDTVEERLKVISEARPEDIAEIVDSYNRYNRASYNQNTEAILELVHCLAIQGEINPHLDRPEFYDLDDFHQFISKPPKGFENQYPEGLQMVIREIFAPRIGIKIFGKKRFARFDTWYNQPLKPGVRRQDWRRYMHQHSAKVILGQEAEKHRHETAYQELVEAAKRFGFIH